MNLQYFEKKYFTSSTICKSERTAFVIFLEKSKVRMPLMAQLPSIIYTIVGGMSK